MTRRPLAVALLPVLLLVPVLAHGAGPDPDLVAGTKALVQAYEQSDGDEAGYGGTFVEQCRLETGTTGTTGATGTTGTTGSTGGTGATGATGTGKAVRCVLVDGQGDSNLDTKDRYDTTAPQDFGVARFAADGSIVTSREPFAEPPVQLKAKIKAVAKLTPSGRVAVRVGAAVPTRVTVSAEIGGREIRANHDGVARTVELDAGAPVAVALKLRASQKRQVRALRRSGGSLRAVIDITVIGDVGPADASDHRVADVRLKR